jgi:hypothetical protein
MLKAGNASIPSAPVPVAFGVCERGTAGARATYWTAGNDVRRII